MAACLTKRNVADSAHRSEEPQTEAPRDTPLILVIGYGNTLRGDDGLGWQAAERLRDSRQWPTNVEIHTCHQLTMDLSEPISRASYLILIDASSGDSPGQIAMRPLYAKASATDSLHHHQPPEALLAYTHALFGRVPPAWLWTVTASVYDFGEQLSAPVEAALPALIAQIAAFIDTLLAQSPIPGNAPLSS